jgi:hypothetical protein
LRRFGGTSERRYRRRLWSAAYRPSTLLTKQFVTENGGRNLNPQIAQMHTDELPPAQAPTVSQL